MKFDLNMYLKVFHMTPRSKEITCLEVKGEATEASESDKDIPA